MFQPTVLSFGTGRVQVEGAETFARSLLHAVASSESVRTRWPAEFAVLPLKLLQPLALCAGQAAELAPVDAGPADPLADELGSDAQLVGDSRDRAVALALRGHVVNELTARLLWLRWIPTRR